MEMGTGITMAQIVVTLPVQMQFLIGYLSMMNSGKTVIWMVLVIIKITQPAINASGYTVIHGETEMVVWTQMEMVHQTHRTLEQKRNGTLKMELTCG